MSILKMIGYKPIPVPGVTVDDSVVQPAIFISNKLTAVRRIPGSI
jgi:hypothetical protein